MENAGDSGLYTVMKIPFWGYFIIIYALQALSQAHVERPDSVGLRRAWNCLVTPGLAWVLYTYMHHVFTRVHFNSDQHRAYYRI